MRVLTRNALRLATTLVLAIPSAAWAQTAPPQPTLNRFPPPWIGYLVVFFLLALVMVASMMPSKRGHQD